MLVRGWWARKLPKLTADLDKMPFSKQEWYDLEIPISAQTSVQFEESGKSPEDVFRETLDCQGSIGPSVALYVHPTGAGRRSSLREGRCSEIRDAGEEGAHGRKQYVGGYGLWAPVISVAARRRRPWLPF